MAYTYEDAMRDAPSKTYNEGVPSEVGFYVTASKGGCCDIRWWSGRFWSIRLTAHDARNCRLDLFSEFETSAKITGWLPPWWPHPHLDAQEPEKPKKPAPKRFTIEEIRKVMPKKIKVSKKHVDAVRKLADENYCNGYEMAIIEFGIALDNLEA